MTTFGNADIRRWGSCYDPIRYFSDEVVHTPLSILRDERISPADRVWCVVRLELMPKEAMAQFALACARRVEHLGSPQARECNDATGAFLAGDLSKEDLKKAAWAAAAEAWSAAEWAGDRRAQIEWLIKYFEGEQWLANL